MNISVVCFAASYGLTLLLEISRLFFRIPVRVALMIAITVAGLVAHSLYLVAIARDELAAGAKVALLSSWHDWCLVAAWVLTATYVGMVFRRPQNAVGMFLLPLILILIGVAVRYRDLPPFDRQDALWVWGMVHGIALLMGTVAVILGFAAGLMYLVQSYRLKHKIAPQQGPTLPSLEWLLRLNRRALLVSTVLLAGGLISGIVLNLNQNRSELRWNDPIILSSGLLFAWLLIATCFEFSYRPAREGRKVAYLTLANFLFLAVVMWIVLQGQHAGANRAGVGPPKGSVERPLPGRERAA